MQEPEGPDASGHSSFCAALVGKVGFRTYNIGSIRAGI